MYTDLPIVHKLCYSDPAGNRDHQMGFLVELTAVIPQLKLDDDRQQREQNDRKLQLQIHQTVGHEPDLKNSHHGSVYEHLLNEWVTWQGKRLVGISVIRVSQAHSGAFTVDYGEYDDE